MNQLEDPGTTGTIHSVIGRILSVGVVLAVVVAGGQGVTASSVTARAASPTPSKAPGAPSPTPSKAPRAPSPTPSKAPRAPSPTPSKAQKVAAEQSRADSAGQSLRLGSGEKLVVKDVITDADGTTHVRYNRTFNGLRVIGGDLVSHRDKSGRIKGVNWNGSHDVAVASTKPKMSLASANAFGTRMASRVQKATTATKGELVVYSGSFPEATPKLAYDVLTNGVRADQTPSRLHTIVDANTGGTLASWDEIENGTGNGIYVGTVTIGTTAGPPWTMRDTDGNYATDLNGQGSGSGSDIPGVPGTIFTDPDNNWGNGANTDPASAGVDAQYGAEQTFDYFNTMGRNGIWDDGVGARSRVHYGINYANAFWDGTQMTYGDGASNTHPLVELDVAGHEMTHGVTENTAGLGYVGEAGGLNEATSDIFGTAVEWYANNASDTPDYLIGELINGDGTPLRYMDQPSKDGASRDCWSSTLGSLDPHYSSGPLNHWFYLASEGSGAKVINGIRYNSPTCNNSTVTPIGRDKAEKIWYRTLTTYLTSSDTYAAARDGAIQSAKDIYGATSAECTGIEASFSAISVPVGAVTCGITPQPPSGSNLLRNPGFESGDNFWSATANVISQWGSAQTPQPAHSGTWSAWLCGYGVTHADSISQLITIPAASSATLTYNVHIDTYESPDSAYDTLTVSAGSTPLETLSNLDAANGYQLRTVDLSAYAGKTISLSFSGVEDAAAATSFVIDDTSVTTTPSSATAPGAPTGVSAAAGDGQAVVSWTAPVSDGGSAITGYTVTAAPDGASATTTGATTASVTGLSNGTAYTITVTATNAAGTSPASDPSAAVTPGTAPGAPVIGTAAASDASAVVRWTAPATNGGSAITGYTVRVVDSATSAQGALRSATAGATSLTVTSLANGTAYKFQVLATNEWGSSPYSALSNAVTPAATASVTRLSDYNRDGFTDLIARDSAGILWLYPGDGAGGFLVRHQMGTGWSIMTALVTPGDVTGDGNADVVARDAAGVLWLYPGNGASGLSARRRIGSGWNVMNTITNAADMNGAGRPDLLARDSAGVLWLYPMTGNAVFGARVKIGTGWQAITSILGSGDVSGDGRPDVLARDAAGVLRLYRGNGAGDVAAGTQVSTGWQTMTALVAPGNWDCAVGNDLLARDAAGILWLYPGNSAGGLGQRRAVGSGWNGMNYIG